MKKFFIPLFIALSAAAFVFSANASAAEGKAMTPQQQKFANCAHQSKGMKGDAHKEFMSKCLKGNGAMGNMKVKKDEHKKKAESMTTAQREKMKNCNTQAKDKKLKGNDRRSFMSECLKD